MMAATSADWVVSEILGHADVEVTRGHYLHSTAEQRQKALASLGGLLG